MAFPPKKNVPMHKSAQRESRPHSMMFGMSQGQVGNLQGSTGPVTRPGRPVPERSQGFRFPSSYSGAAKPGGPKKGGKPYRSQGPWVEK